MWMAAISRGLLLLLWGIIMAVEPTAERKDQPIIYQIRIRGHLGQPWQDWFDGLTLTYDADGNTLLTGPIVDQAALYGILKQVSDLGMPLLSLCPSGPGLPEECNQPTGDS
jgi:hypothetical protein